MHTYMYTYIHLCDVPTWLFSDIFIRHLLNVNCRHEWKKRRKTYKRCFLIKRRHCKKSRFLWLKSWEKQSTRQWLSRLVIMNLYTTLHKFIWVLFMSCILFLCNSILFSESVWQVVEGNAICWTFLNDAWKSCPDYTVVVVVVVVAVIF